MDEVDESDRSTAALGGRAEAMDDADEDGGENVGDEVAGAVLWPRPPNKEEKIPPEQGTT